jgi:hypothetical protein
VCLKNLCYNYLINYFKKIYAKSFKKNQAKNQLGDREFNRNRSDFNNFGCFNRLDGFYFKISHRPLRYHRGLRFFLLSLQALVVKEGSGKVF